MAMTLVVGFKKREIFDGQLSAFTEQDVFYQAYLH